MDNENIYANIPGILMKDILSPVARTYELWDLEEETLAKVYASRIEEGLGVVDIWNFDDFVATVVGNGIIHLDIERHRLSNQNVWNEFRKDKESLSFARFDSFDKSLYFIARSLQEYASDGDSFFKYRGVQELKNTLNAFLDIFPELKGRDDFLEDEEKPVDGLIIRENLGEQYRKKHDTMRKLHAVSNYDAVHLDIYLANLLGKGFKRLAKTTHGHPADLTEEEWDRQLNTVAEEFSWYTASSHTFSEEMREIFVERFQSFWD